MTDEPSDLPGFDLVVYAATPAGVAAAVAAARLGVRVLLLEPDQHVGGLNTSGLNNNEQHHMFPAETFGGICREFFDALARHYPETWPARPGWFNSRHFESELLRLLEHPQVTVRYDSRLATVKMRNRHIDRLVLEDGTSVGAPAFIDASYEGDLLAAAEVPTRIGREGQSEVESMAGVTWADPLIPVDPHDAEGVLPGLSDQPPPPEGEASAQVQVMNFRITLTSRPDNRIPIPPPQRYEPRDHELLARCIEAGVVTELKQVLGLYPLPNEKFECNNNQRAVVSLAMRSIATRWATAMHEQRREIFGQLHDYNLSLMHFLAEDPRVPESIQQQMHSLGLPADEFTDNGHWPYEPYIREARRMAGLYTMTERDLRDDRRKDDAVCLGSHYIDCHWVDRYAIGDEGFCNEGRLWLKGRIFQIPYRCMLPPPQACSNLLVPVCVSATHVAFCGIRVEPTWMKLGEAAGTAAALALEAGRDMHGVDTGTLRSRLEGAGQIIDLTDAAAQL